MVGDKRCSAASDWISSTYTFEESGFSGCRCRRYNKEDLCADRARSELRWSRFDRLLSGGIKGLGLSKMNGFVKFREVSSLEDFFSSPKIRAISSKGRFVKSSSEPLVIFREFNEDDVDAISDVAE